MHIVTNIERVNRKLFDHSFGGQGEIVENERISFQNIS